MSQTPFHFLQNLFHQNTIRPKLALASSKISTIATKYPVVFPLALLALALVSYGIFITSLGFYWDDWPPILLSHLPDKSLIWEYFTYDRPFQSWTYYLLFPICGDSAFLWQLSVILARWTAGLSLYYSFLIVFPRQKILLQWATFLFVVFPGFADQFASVSYGSHFIVYTVFGLSLLFLALAFKTPNKFWLYFPISLVFTTVHLFTMEYFVGLELLRPLIIFWLLTDNGHIKGKLFFKTILNWLPYLVIFGVYIYWRMVIYTQNDFGVEYSNSPYFFIKLMNDPVNAIMSLLQSVYSDLHFLMVDIWASRVLPTSIDLQSLSFWLAIIIGIGFAFVLTLFFHEQSEDDGFHLTKKEIIRNSLFSFAIFFFGLFPIWSSLRQITIGKWSDRFGIPVIFGISIIVFTLLFIVISKPKTRKIFFILIVGLSISFQIQNANTYRKDFIQQKNFYTQLTWRIPSLEPGTIIYSPGIPTSKEADYSISMGINMLFTSGEMDPSLDYWFVTPRYYKALDLVTDPTIEFNEGLRIFNFQGSASKVVSIHSTAQGCLWVIDHYYAINPEKIDQLYYYGELTNQSLIGESGSQTNNLSKIIDTSPQKTWCYYFEKGDLAQSKGKYQEAVAYYEQATSEEIVPLESIEFLPFVKAYIKLGRIEEAVELTAESYRRSTLSNQAICQVWHDALEENPEIPLDKLESVYNPDICKNLEP